MPRSIPRFIVYLAIALTIIGYVTPTAAAAPANQASGCITDTVTLEGGISASSRDFFVGAGNYTIDVKTTDKEVIHSHYWSDAELFLGKYPVPYVNQIGYYVAREEFPLTGAKPDHIYVPPTNSQVQIWFSVASDKKATFSVEICTELPATRASICGKSFSFKLEVQPEHTPPAVKFPFLFPAGKFEISVKGQSLDVYTSYSADFSEAQATDPFTLNGRRPTMQLIQENTLPYTYYDWSHYPVKKSSPDKITINTVNGVNVFFGRNEPQANNMNTAFTATVRCV